MIDEIAIGTNKYGDPTDSIKLYGYGEAQNLTLGQLVNAVCCRAGFALETQSVSLVNVMTVRTRRLSAAAKVMQMLVDGAEKGYDTELELEGYGTITARKFLTEVMGYKITVLNDNAEKTVKVQGDLPADVSAENDRLKVYSAMKEKLDTMTTESQRRMIDLQSCMSRRDVVFASATNIVQTLGAVLQTVADNY